MPFNPNDPVERYDQISAARNMNANSHPDAKIAYTALNKVFKTRKAKTNKAAPINKQPKPVQPALSINITPKPTV